MTGDWDHGQSNISTKQETPFIHFHRIGTEEILMQRAAAQRLSLPQWMPQSYPITHCNGINANKCISALLTVKSKMLCIAYQLDNFFWLNFVIMMYNLIKQCNSGWKMTPFALQLVSNKPCFYHDIFFATRTRVSLSWLAGLCCLSWDGPVYSTATFHATV